MILSLNIRSLGTSFQVSCDVHFLPMGTLCHRILMRTPRHAARTWVGGAVGRGKGERQRKGRCYCCLATQECPTLFRCRMDCGPLGSSVHEISQQEYWRGLPFPSQGELPNLGIKPGSSALAGGFFTTEPTGKGDLKGG